MERPVVVVVGTRPEAIKLLLLHEELNKAGLTSILISTDQHDKLLTQVFGIFNIYPDISLNIMIEDQDLFHITKSVLERIKDAYLNLNPRMVIVQGDTTTAFAAALAAFYLKIPIAHVEAGLRSGNILAPYPEEMNRACISHIADYNFAPTYLSYANLLSSGIERSKIFLTGNTVVDSLFWIKNKIISGEISISTGILSKVFECKRESKKIVLFTAHRRESFGAGLINIFRGVKSFMGRHRDVTLFYPMHPNPVIHKIFIDSGLSDVDNVLLMEPLLYKDLIYLLLNCDFVVTDSGGIQEEAMSLGKRVIIMREITERLEGVWDGLGKLVGMNDVLLMQTLEEFCNKTTSEQPTNVFGDGKSVYKIVQLIKSKFDSAGIKSIKCDMLNSEKMMENV